MNYWPYGALHVEHIQEVAFAPPPRLWNIVPLDDFRKWRDDTTEDIADGLWPKWDYTACTWTGGAVANMDAVTDYDLSRMQGLLDELKKPVSTMAGAPTHLQLFRIEDGQSGEPGDRLRFYDRQLDPDTLRFDPARIFCSGMDFLVGPTTLFFKANFQRPRAYQLATLRGDQRFGRYHGNTADSPSLVSGHCLEGCLGGAWVAMRLQQWTHGVDWSLAGPAMEKWSVDIGDRRVFAQVHYPTDNISSWWAAITMLRTLDAHHVPEAPGLLAFLMRSIAVSTVYRFLWNDRPPGQLFQRVEKEIGPPR